MVTHWTSVNASRLACTAAVPGPGARLADAAEGNQRLVVDRLVVDVHQPGRNPLGQRQALHHIAGQNAEGQAVFGAAGQPDRLVEAGERHDRGDRAEDLLGIGRARSAGHR